MNGRYILGAARVALLVAFAVGSPVVRADDTFDGCTFYTRMKVAGNANTACPVINTGFKPNGTTSVDAKYRQFELSGTSCLFSARDKANGSGPYFTYFSMVSGGAARWDYEKSQKSTGVNSALAPNYRLIIENGTANLYTSLDRAAIATASQTASSFAATYNLYLFGSNTGDTSFDNGGRFYFYYLKVYDGPIADGKLQHHYVPCKTSDGTLGVADLVDEKVYTPKQHPSALSVVETDSVGGVRSAVDESLFSNSATFTASGYAGSETLEDFPVLVRLSTAIANFSYDDCGENGEKIRFADTNGKLLAHEIDTWDTAGESLVWVNVPKLSKTTEFNIYVGGDGTSATLPASSIWRRAGYKFVFHNNITATTAGADSAGSGLVGVAEQSALAVNTGVAGAPLGSCEDLVTCNSGGGSHGWHIDNNTYWGGHGGQLSMSIWTYRTDTSDTYNRALIGSPAKYVTSIYTSTTTGHLTINSNLDACNKTLPVKSGNWMQIQAVMNDKYYQFYQNGALVSGMELSTAMADNTTATFAVGSKNLADRNKGYLDEPRLRWEVSSADWVKAEHDTVASNAFLVCSGFASADPDMPELKNCETDVNTNGNILVAGTVKRHAAEVTVTLTAEGRSPVVVSLGEVAAGADFKRELGEEDGLSKFVTYTVTITAANGEKVAETTLPNEVKYGKIEPADFDSKFSIDLSADIRTLLGTTAYTNFPVLVRLPAEASALIQSGDDVMVRDQTGAELAWDLETWNPAGVSYLWVKVPELSSSTVLTGYVGCAETEAHDASAVWSRYVGVWHFASGEAGGSTAADATGHALDGTTTGTFATLDGPFGDRCVMAGAKVTAPDYEPAFGVGAKFTASGWFLLPTMVNTDYATVIKKKGSTWNAANGWYLEMSDSGKDTAFTTLKAILTDSVPSTKITDVRKNWHYYQVVSDGSTFKVYLDGSTTAAISQTYKVVANSELYTLQYTKEATDECRIRKGAASAAETRLEYLTMKDEAFFTYGELEPADPAAPMLNAPVISPNGDGTFTVSETITMNMPLAGSVKVYYNGELTAMTTTDTEVPATYVATITPSAADVTDMVEVRAKSAAGGSRSTSGVFYSGELAIEKVRDASEKGLTNGIWRVTREDDSLALPVAFAKLASSTATAGVDYVDFPLSATIPDGTNCVEITLTPLMNLARAEDTWVDLAISNGAYRIDSAKDSARVTIKNYDVPAGGNVWCATSAGKASVAANWQTGIVPDSYTSVVFDGDISNADCEWDLDATHAVANWTQQANYTGTVTIDTTYGDAFPELAVSGDMLVLGGQLTQQANEAGDNTGTYRLKLAVGGIFDLASGTKVDCSLKGFWGACKPSGSQCGSHAASGDGYQYVYGDVYRPADLGAGCANAGSESDLKCGGGAVWIECGGKAVVDGTINVRGRQFDGGNSGCGSVYLKAKSCDGSGKILADFSATGYYNGSKGSAGRVGIELTEATALGLPVENIGITGCCSGSSGGGGGTLCVKTAADAYGTLYLDDTRAKSYGARWQKWKAITAIPQGESWTFDRIVIANYGMLCVPPKTELHLPNGPQSVTASSVRQGGIFYQGGVLDFGERDTYEFSDGWIFQANQPYTFNGDVVVKKGGALGCLRFSGSTDLTDFAGCNIIVEGDLTIEDGGYVYAYGGGPDLPVNRTAKASHGGIAAAYGTVNAAYDKIFDPKLPGYGLAYGDQAESCVGGGVVKLTVSGKLTNNGVITANGHAHNSNSGAAGGSINIYAEDLVGAGAIRANSASGAKGGTGGGGRIAIHLGSEAACTDTVFGRINATGYTLAKSSAVNSSAGTVYLRVGDDREDGTITVKNDGNTNNDNTFTPIPVGNDPYQAEPETAAELASASLTIDGAAKVMLTDNLSGMVFRILGNSTLDLAGKVYTVRSAYVNGDKLSLGEYVAGDAEFGDMLVDSAGGGKLKVTGYGIWVFVQ